MFQQMLNQLSGKRIVMTFTSFSFTIIVDLFPVAYAENSHGGFIQWCMAVICIWCPLFVTSQFDVMFIQTNVLAKFFDIIHILQHALPLIFVSLNMNNEYEQSALLVRISEENATTQNFITAKI